MRALAYVAAASAVIWMALACDPSYQPDADLGDAPEYTPPGDDEDQCEVHAGDDRDDIEITDVSEDFLDPVEGAEVEVWGRYLLHSRDDALVHPFSCGTSALTRPALVHKGEGAFNAGYEIYTIIDPDAVAGCLIVLVYDLDGEKLLSCRFHIE